VVWVCAALVAGLWGAPPTARAGQPPSGCGDAAFAFEGTTPFDTTGATTDGPADCPDNGSPPVEHDVWFDYFATCSGTLTVDTCEDLGGWAIFDSKIVVYDGCSCAPPSPQLDCNDDADGLPCGTSGGGYQSALTVPVVQGNCYKIRVGSYASGEFGPGELHISCSAPPQPCATDLDCIDQNGDGIRDDTCVLAHCDNSACDENPVSMYGDMGGPSGSCQLDGVTDGGDAFHAMHCFGNSNTMGQTGYPCEPNPPLALFVDAGGRAGSCAPDGVCDLNDRFHALNSYAFLGPCVCPDQDLSDPPVVSDPLVRVFMSRDGEQAAQPASGPTAIVLQPGETATVMAWIEDLGGPSDLLGAYQLILPDTAAALGGASGSVTYVDINPGQWGGNSVNVAHLRPDWVFAGAGSQLVDMEAPALGLFGNASTSGVGVDPGAGAAIRYLLEFQVQASPDASGQFELVFVRPPVASPRPVSDLFRNDPQNGPTGAEYPVGQYQSLIITVPGDGGPAADDNPPVAVAFLGALADPRDDPPAPGAPAAGPAGNCQSPDQQAHGCQEIQVSAASSDVAAGWAAADKFTPIAAAVINEVTWWGGYLSAFQVPPADCGPGPGDDFTITYYHDDAGGLLPGTPIAVFDVNAIKVVTGEAIGGLADEYMFVAVHPNVAVPAGQCTWIEIRNNTGPDSECVWMWETAPPGDELSVQARSVGTGAVTWESGDERAYDLSWCVDDSGAGTVAVSANGCPAVGACCDDTGDNCQNGVTAAACFLDNGGASCSFEDRRFQAGATCQTLDPPCGTGGCCLPDGSCIDVLEENCAGNFNAGALCADLLCPELESCSWNNGGPEPFIGAVSSQYSGGTGAEDFYAEAAAHVTLDGSVQNPCAIESIVWYVQHFNHALGGCSGNPACTDTPNDYQAIRLAVYDDAADQGLIHTHTAACATAIPQSNTYGAPDTCATAAECAPGQACMDNDGDGSKECAAVCEISVPGGAAIIDLDVSFNIAHTWQGDLVVSLEHIGFGSPVRLMNRPGDTDLHSGGYLPNGYAVDDFGAGLIAGTLNDEAVNEINIYDGPNYGIPNYSGPAVPGGGADASAVLSGFDGQPPAGVWRLYISDHFGQADGGTITDWSLRFNDVEVLPPTGAPEHAAGAPTGDHTGVLQGEMVLGPGEYQWAPLMQGGSPVPGAFVVTLDVSGLTLHNLRKSWLAIAPVVPLEGYYQTAWMSRRLVQGRTAAQQAFESAGLPPWQQTGKDLAFEVIGIPNPVLCPTGSLQPCTDRNLDHIRDDACVWYECVQGVCVGTDVAFANVGGAFGQCVPEFNASTADGHDRFHALNCFSNQNTQGQTPYPCEENPADPSNVDAGGAFGACAPDGACDGHDAFHALNAFQQTNPCSCSAGPAPAHAEEPAIVAGAGLTLRASARSVLPGEYVDVDVFLADELADLRGYQLHLGVAGGESGTLQLVDISIRQASALAVAAPEGVKKDGTAPRGAGGAYWSAFNAQTGQMVAGLDGPGVAAGAGAYLATFTFLASPDAAGTFAVQLLHDEAGREHRTFLFPTPAGAKIAVTGSNSAVIGIGKPGAARLTRR
jgi:subtilisin-like proprotein convertase family protein